MSENRIQTVMHPEQVEAMQDKLMDDRSLMRLVDFYKLFSDMSRLKILYLLSMEEMCVCDLAALLNMTQSAISHQLRILRSSRLVKSRKQGRVVYYSLDDAHIGEIFSLAFTHIMEEREG